MERVPELDLIRAFEYYLLATFVLSAVQLRHQIALYRFVMRARERWPSLYALVRSNLHVLITLPVLLAVGATAALWATQLALRLVVWPEASLAPQTLWAQPILLFVALVGLFPMVALDARAIFHAASFRAPQRQWLLDLTEAALQSNAIPPLRAIVEWRLRVRLIQAIPLVRRWMWRRSEELGARIVMGTALWGAWFASA